MNPYDPMAQGQMQQGQMQGQMMNPYGQPQAAMNTNPYIREAQQLPQGMGGGGNPQAYMQNTSDQMASQQMAGQNLAQVQAGIGKAVSGGGGAESSVTPQARAEALRNMGNKIGDYANQANVASGNKYDTNFGSEQSRMLAMQEAGLS